MLKDIKLIGSHQKNIIACTENLIETHYSIVYPLVKNTDEEVYKALMKESIDQGNAYCYEDNSCFMYYRKTTKHEGFGVCFYGKNNSYKMIKLLSYIFNVKDKDTNVLRFKPHDSKGIKDYKSLLVKSSIKKFYQYGGLTVIRVDILRNKLVRIVDKVTGNE